MIWDLTHHLPVLIRSVYSHAKLQENTEKSVVSQLEEVIMEFDDENYADYNTPQVSQEHSDEVRTLEHTSSESEESKLLSNDQQDLRTYSDKNHSTQHHESSIDHSSIDTSVDNNINGHNITGSKDIQTQPLTNTIMDSDASSELDEENLDKSQ